MRVPISVEPLEKRGRTSRSREPVTFGLPLPAGALPPGAGVRLLDEQGTSIPVQTRALDRWMDTSIRWLLIDFQADTNQDGVGHYILVVAEQTPADVLTAGIQIDESSGGLAVDTGEARFIMQSGSLVPFCRVERLGTSVIDRAAVLLEDAGGAQWPFVIERVTLEEQGPLRSVVRLEGSARRGGRSLLDIVLRLHFFAASSCVKCVLTVRNARRAKHAGGYWNLGDPGSIFLRDLSIVAALAENGVDVTACCSAEPGQPMEQRHAPFELYQDSSGGEWWHSPAHVNRNGVVPNTFRGYRLRSGGLEHVGLRATPTVAVQSGNLELFVTMRHFWQNCPKAIEVRGRELRLRLFPNQYADVHELQGGEQKTHTFVIAFGPDRVAPQPLEWCRIPLVARADPAWYARARAVPLLTPVSDEQDSRYLALVQAAVEGTASFEAKREIIDEYGWRHFGDLYADHESVFHVGSHPRVSHYNTQYDALAGFACWFMRTADLRWWTLMGELAAHVMDIDVYHTQRDRAAYNGGLFWHTYHYSDAGLSTHRSYPRGASGVPGGGPSAEHAYTTGLMLHHFLTGDPASRETALELGEWIMAVDDGRRSRCRWLAGGATGLASASGSLGYHGPGRAGGNSVSVLVDSHRLTGDGRFLRQAEALIRRCIHPNQDIGALHLEDSETRWSYTIFLQALGKYLEHKHERGELDAMCAYAQASLLHYARWMAASERPYLERPEILEYPTETWAAQDMRKSDVFRIAALHGAGAEREQFLERAEFFFQYSVATLSAMPTRTLARPVVIMLTTGFGRAWFQRQRDRLPDAVPRREWPAAWTDNPFVPQKMRALRRLAAMAVVATTAGFLALAVVLFGR